MSHGKRSCDSHELCLVKNTFKKWQFWEDSFHKKEWVTKHFKLMNFYFNLTICQCTRYMTDVIPFPWCSLNVPSIQWSNFLLISDCWTLPLSILKLFKPPLFLSWESCSCLLFWVFALMPQIKHISFQTPQCTPPPAILIKPQ